MSQEGQPIVIVGGGLVGSLMACFMAKRGLRVTVYERRADMRHSAADEGRSINLVVTSRGLEALRRVGLEDDVLQMTVPVHGRMMHALDGKLSYQPYGRDESECNYSISRGELNRFLISAAAERGVDFRFSRGLAEADFDRGRLSFRDETGGEVLVADAALVLGADGALSAVRAQMTALPGFDDRLEPLGHSYKELLIPAAADGRYRIEKNALHIWPRGGMMLMALPNLDGSFTVTLYLPDEGPDGFHALDDGDKVLRLFREQFPDAIPLIPDLTEEFFSNPTGKLATVRCRPWHYRDRALLIGDAAHGIVPFFGQGMNCGFEDCRVLDELLEEIGIDDRGRLFREFDQARKVNGDAIADMALENFVEMRDHVGDDRFLLRKAVEHRLESEIPREYRSRYSMVMYSSIPYSVAMEAGRIQEGILAELCEGLGSADDLDLERARALIRKKLAPYLETRAVALDY